MRNNMKLLLYCTKGKPYLYKDRGIEYALSNKKLVDNAFTRFNPVNGKIVAECDFEVEKMGLDTGKGLVFDRGFNEESQLELFEIAKYVGNNYYYAIHIKNLHIFDESKELKEYYNNGQEISYLNSVWENYGMPDYDEYEEIQIKKAPQNMMYCYDCNGEKKIIISIHPEWLCKILNGEKTIEIRKKVLRGMLENL